MSFRKEGIDISNVNLNKYVNSSTIFDGDINSDRYFGVYDLPSSLNLGPNRFSLKLNRDNLVPSSRVYIQIIDSQGNEVPFETPDKLNSDFSLPVIVQVTEDVAPGRCKIFVSGRASRDVIRNREIPFSDNTFDSNFRDNPNVIWVGTSNISLEQEVDQPPEFVQSPTVEVTQKTVEHQNFDSERYQEITGSALLTYNPVTFDLEYSDNSSTLPEIEAANTEQSTPVVELSGSISIKSTSQGNIKKPPVDRLPVLSSSETGSFSSDMEGGTVVLRPSVSDYVPPVAISSIGTIPEYTAKVVKGCIE